jgi:hypothetical protein
VVYLVDKNQYIGYHSVSKILLTLFFSLIGALIPQWSQRIFFIEVAIILLGIIVSYFLYRVIENGRIYHLRTAAIMSFLVGAFTVLPLLRISTGSIVFWVVLGAYLLAVFTFAVKYLVILRGKSFPRKLLSITLGTAGILFISSFFIGFKQYHSFVVFSAVLYLCGLFFTWSAFKAGSEK